MNNKIISDKVANKAATPPPSFVKLAMKNMVRKGSQSLFHFGLTAFGFIGFILLVAVLGKPHIPQ
tara:strand:- start:1229 stop:1423 length:195 start_codon:yes stop_codon:yes gene_type:complete